MPRLVRLALFSFLLAASTACQSTPSFERTQPAVRTLDVRTVSHGSLTLPNRASSVKFAVIGDSGRGTPPQHEIAAQMTAYRAEFPFAFVLMLGDNIYGRQEAHDLKQGGALTPQEKARINREQNQVSRNIYQQKHDAQTGNPNSASSKRLQADVQRNANQQQRIANGINNGQLTNKEAGHLEGGQARVNRAEANAAANGHVGAGEQAKIQGKENRQSNRVYDKKHNDKPRGGGE